MESMRYNFDFNFINLYWNSILDGSIITLKLSLLTIICSTIIAIIFGILMTQNNKFIQYTSILIVDIIRSIPLLVVILISYYAFPSFGVNTESFWPALFALTIDTGAFLSDVIRGGIEGIAKGSVLAGRSLGMNYLLILRRIILPEVLREILPTITLMYIGVIRLSSLASVIAVNEITHTGNWIISSTFKPLETYIIVGLIYTIMVLPLMLLSRKIEKNNFFKRRSL